MFCLFTSSAPISVYGNENPRGKKKNLNQTTSQSPGGFPPSIFRRKAERNPFMLLVLGNPGKGHVFVPAGMGLRQEGKTQKTGISTDTS